MSSQLTSSPSFLRIAGLYKSSCTSCFAYSKKKAYVTRKWLSNKFPTASDVRTALSKPAFHSAANRCGSFAYVLNMGVGCFCNPSTIGPHSQVHLILNGTLLRPMCSPSDPFFFLHHVNVDRLFTRWLRRVRPSKFEILSFKTPQYGGCRECAIAGIVPPVTNEDMMTDPISLGFDYEDLDFGPVKASEVIASPFNTKTRACPSGGSQTGRAGLDKERLQEMTNWISGS